MTLIGRQVELRVVRDHLQRHRNLAICGAAGVGKTALVAEAIGGRTDALYCANSATLKAACESLLAQLYLDVAVADNVARKRAILTATAGKKRWFIFDHVGRVRPKLAAFLENVHDAHPMIVIIRSLAWTEIGHLKMILWDFDTLELRNLSPRDACRLAEAEATRLGIRVSARELARLSRGNPRHLLELCAQAERSPLVSSQLLELDRRIGKLKLNR